MDTHIPAFRVNFLRSPSHIRCGDELVTAAGSECLPERHAAGHATAVPVVDGCYRSPDSQSSQNSVSAEQLQQVSELLAQVSEAVQELQQQQRQSLAEVQQATVALSVAAASWLTGVAIEADQFAVDDLIRMALERLDADSPVQVQLNPKDLALLQQLQLQIPSADGDLMSHLVCSINSELPRGSCRLESGSQILISDMDTRLEEIRRLWMENLDAAQVERRGDGTHGRQLRRFPDRRETA